MTEEVEKPLESLSDEEKTIIIANAVKEVHLSDILLCGKCNEVYHLLEDFKEHKESENCKENGEIKDALKDDKKPQMWAYTLWKNTKFKKLSEGEKGPTTWDIRHAWQSMKDTEKERWITVASNMQGLFEIVADFERSKNKHLIKDVADSTEAKNPLILNKVIKFSNTRKAFRSGTDPKEEHLVEKMVSKRYNPRKKTFEYLVKWELLDSEQNTWESTAALHNCKSMMDEFEKQLQSQREHTRNQKSIEKARKAAERPTYTEGRPQRTSKQKALNQVKAWCGAENQEDGGKRMFSDDSDDDLSMDKRVKLEPESDSDDAQPIVTIKRVTKNGVERRVGSAQRVDTITLPENILIPDAKGIVRISQKQIPSLSSGVYVMSKTAGIIKLDTAAATKLTQGGGQTVLKVAPKVGQASIKVIKKSVSDMSNGAGTKMTVKSMTTTGHKPIVKNYSGKVYMQRRTTSQAAVAAQAKKNEAEFERELKYDDESDGIEELEFPEEIQLPTADSPPPEFSLCPLTGKVVDKNGTVIESEETEVELESGCDIKKECNMDEDKLSEEVGVIATAVTAASSSLGNLVSIAAADILEDLSNSELKSEAMEMTDDELTLNLHAIKADVNATTAQATVKMSQSPPPLVPATPSPNRVQQAISATKPSILSTALTNANIVRRGPPKLVRRSEPRGGVVQTRTPPHHIVRQVGNSQSPTVLTRIAPSGGVRQVRPAPQIIRKRIVQVPAGHGHGQVRQVVQRSVVRQPTTRVYQQVVKSTPSSQVTQVTYVATPTNSNKMITMPQLVDTSPVATMTAPIVQKEKPVAKVTQAHVQQVQQVQQIQHIQQVQQVVQPPVQQEIASTSVEQETTTLSLADGDPPLLITGEDGTIYQVAGQNEEGQTILITQGEDGEQQCLLVAPENAGLITQALAKTPEVQAQVEQVQQVQETVMVQEEQSQIAVDQQLAINTTVDAPEEVTDDSQVVAQIVQANPPSPGGTRKVVLMLPDGNFMMTEVTAEQYAALELDK